MEEQCIMANRRSEALERVALINFTHPQTKREQYVTKNAPSKMIENIGYSVKHVLGL